MRLYEIGIIIRADVAEEERQALLVNLQGRIEANDGAVLETNHWGRRRLEYPIQRQREGYYVFVKAQMPSSTPFEIDRTISLNESILRHIIIVQGE